MRWHVSLYHIGEVLWWVVAGISQVISSTLGHFCISASYQQVIIKLSRMSLNFGDISGVELREKPQDESDLEDDLDLDFI